MPQLLVTSALTGQELFCASYEELGGNLVPGIAVGGVGGYVVRDLKEKISASTGTSCFCQVLMQDGQILEEGDLLHEGVVTVALQPAVQSYSAELLRAAEAMQVEEVRKILKQFQDPNVSSDGDTPLTLVARGDGLEMARLLLCARADVNHASEDGLTPLHVAAESPTADGVCMVELLLQFRADPALEAVDGSTALHLATQKGKLKVVDRLLSAESSANDALDPLLAIQKSRNSVEEIAEVLPQILCRHEKAQVLLCGLCSDLFGVMAQDMLCRVMSSFPGRLCFLSERFELPEDLRRGVDFLLAPYLSEPIGQADVEMGFLGVPTIGCAAGALGRMPGVYFHQQNSTGRDMLKTGFFGAVDYALSLSEEDYWRLAKAATEATATEASFGALWQVNLAKVYDEVVNQGGVVKRTTRLIPATWRPSTDKKRMGEHFDDRLWSNAASQEELHSAMAPRRSSTLRPISSTADLAHQMQVLDIDDDAEFLTQPVSESRAQEIMKAVAESLPYLSDHMDASDLQRDISQARQRLQERSHMTRGLMKPFARGLCLRIHLVMAICYVTSSVGELLLHTLQVEAEVDGDDQTPPFNELWLSFYLALSLGSLLWP
eukprot:s915_g11.t1